MSTRSIQPLLHCLFPTSRAHHGFAARLANLSVAFARLGLRSGILDADVFGPSIPNLFDLSGEPRLSSSNQLLPLTNYGVKTMSLGYLVGEKSALVWRGPMVIKAIQQLLHQVEWGGLDILVLDLPPGTGDVQLTITQQVILDGSVIVTTPHSLATRDAVKGISMFRTVNVNILGLVQNMSLYNCPHCHTQSHIFGSDQLVKSMCEEHGMDLLGDVPLHPAVCVQGDGAKLAIVSHPSGDIASAFIKIARAICHKINLPADY
ncbi:hypothetical protein CDD82_3336 [Ophiocordyceps australis]|uniref:Uncharacterized protein n=1 Tax=Ophiocordyceps australis TaxID=1399860 RepID=A0A2C5XQ69_9HYPO|nr:hypothetical protein CDD82_3336 [Ophiocordyceps australis]